MEEPSPESHDRLNNLIAVSVAVLSAFMAVTKVKDDNIVQAMLQAKSDAVDTWSEYQAKKIKHHLAELGRDQAIAFGGALPAGAAAAFAKQGERFEQDIVKYGKEETELRDKAKAFEKQYDVLNYRDDQFDLSDAALSVCLALMAVTALTRKRWLFVMAWTLASVGIVMGAAGLAGWRLHPDALTRLLS